MKIDKFLQLFVVKEKRFFPLFTESALNIQKAANLLLEQTREENSDKRRAYAHLIKECETKGDQITDKIVDEILDAFVTPFDRDDIHSLAEAMDTFLDCMRDSSKKIAMYQPKKCSKKIIQIAEYIVKDADLLVEITSHFDTMREDAKIIDGLCDKIKEVEHIVDDIYESYMSHIFETETDAAELVKKKNIAEIIEETTDSAKSLSNVVRSVVVKMG